MDCCYWKEIKSIPIVKLDFRFAEVPPKVKLIYYLTLITSKLLYLRQYETLGNF